MATKHTWGVKSRLRARAFGWNGSRLACQRLKEAVVEIKKLARVDPVAASDGVVSLMERVWPAFEHIDTSSGALGSAVNWTQGELLPLVIEAPADRKTRDQWLGRLWQAIQDDGVDYLWMVEDRWGELCGSREVASFWADELLGLLRTAWSDPRLGNYVRGTSVCLSSLVAAGRHEELLGVLALQRFPYWHDRKFGVQALIADGQIDMALAYADASRGLNQPDVAIDAACERILLDAGRPAEAYEKYALTANISSTGLATFRTIARKYPSRDPKQILLDLAASSGDPGHWFAAAKDAGFLDLASKFARTGRTDPRTLSRASRDLLGSDASFCLEVGRLAIQRILDGYGYELTTTDVIDAYNHLMGAALKLGIAAQARNDVLAIAMKANQSCAAFSDTLIRQCSGDPQPLPVTARTPSVTGRRTWRRRRLYNEALSRKPIAEKLVAKMKRRLRAKVVDIEAVINGRAAAEGLQHTVVTKEGLVGFHPAHAAYVYTQNQASVMSEQLTALQEIAPFAEIISKAEHLYVPSAPPMSPLTTSYFTCWGLFDACVGAADETIGTTILEFGAAFGINSELVRLIRLMQESRMGFYIQKGREGSLTVLEELVTGTVYRAIVPSGYRGQKGELWYVRVLPPPFPGGSEHVVFTTPYIVLHPGLPYWLAYFGRALPKTARTADYERHMKYGPTRTYWNDFVFEAYVNYRTDAIYLAGLPDVPESRPHSEVNGWGFSGDSTNQR